MMRHVFSVTCSRVSVDQESNALSMFETIDSIQASLRGEPEYPFAAPLPGVLVNLWTREDPAVPVRGRQKLRLVGPSGDELGTFEVDIDLESSIRSRHLARFDSILFGGPGRHEWEVYFRTADDEDWTLATRIPLDLEVHIEPEEEESSTTDAEVRDEDG